MCVCVCLFIYVLWRVSCPEVGFTLRRLLCFLNTKKVLILKCLIMREVPAFMAVHVVLSLGLTYLK